MQRQNIKNNWKYYANLYVLIINMPPIITPVDIYFPELTRNKTKFALQNMESRKAPKTAQ